MGTSLKLPGKVEGGDVELYQRSRYVQVVKRAHLRYLR